MNKTTFFTPRFQNDIIAPASNSEQGTSLHQAVRSNSLEMIPALIVQGADVNAIDANGESALHLAASHKNFKICKSLIENHADVAMLNRAGLTPLNVAINSSCGEKILRLFIDADVSDKCMSPAWHDDRVFNYVKKALFSANPHTASKFFIKRPKLGSPEIYSSDHGKFLPLSPTNCQSATKPIALLNVGAYEKFGPNYGSIAKFFAPPPDLELLYNEFATCFTLIRVLVNDVSQLVPILDHTMTFFPTLPCLYWILNGHGNRYGIGLGKHSIFTTFHKNVMQELAKRVGNSENRGHMSLWGCENASDKKWTPFKNIAQEFSKNAPGTIIHGSASGVMSIALRFIPNLSALPFIFFQEDFHSENTRIYQNGQLIADGNCNLLVRSRL